MPVIIDPAHSIDNFAKNVCSNAPKITIKPEGADWGVDLFHDVTVDVWTVVKAIYAQERPLHIYRKLAKRAQQRVITAVEILFDSATCLV